MTHAKKMVSMLFTVLAIAMLAACGSSDDETSTANTTTGDAPASADKPAAKAEDQADAIPTIVVRNGKPVDGLQELEYEAGDQIRFRVRSNVADEVHVHGYDVSGEVPAGGSADFSFPADLEGIYEVELHGSEEQIAELRVNP